MDRERMLKCSFGCWYDDFRACTIRSVVLPMPAGFVKFLHADGLTLPSEEDAENDADCDAPSKAYNFREFEDSIRTAIKDLGGAVLPKLNWSAPKDATWISFENSMRCTAPADVYLLLKSSDFLAHDLTLLADCDPASHQLVLRRWCDLNPASEFRCFVRGSKLIAVCQRSYADHYPYIRQEKDAILDDIAAFFDRKIRGRFPDTEYTFDVYRKSGGKLLLLDFNPFCEVTDGLLFSWAELTDSTWPPLPSSSPAADDGGDEGRAQRPGQAVFRFVECQGGIAASQYHRYAFPSDLTDLAAGEDTAKLLDLLSLRHLQDSEEEDEPRGTDEQAEAQS